ncbi:MAG: ABC transporter ATP-binding protein [Pseudomonadota bacterium]
MSGLLTLQNVTKAYPGVVANDDVFMALKSGEVHALLGENGAGKSTLVKMIYGLVKPDSGTMQMMGEAFSPKTPNEARARGVAMVFQHFSLFGALSVAENIALGMSNPPKLRDLSRKIEEVSEAYGLPLKAGRLVDTLSAGEQQRVEIVRCLLQEPKLLIMDEPTSVLTPQEVDVLFGTLRRLRDEGTAILYISHKLEEIRTLCDSATILRGGKVVGTCVPAETSARDMAETMVGERFAVPKRKTGDVGDVRFAARNLASDGLRNVSFDVLAGEILGIGGVAGNGQDALMSALSGETLSAADALTFDGKPIGNMGVSARRLLGVLTAPEERLGHAAVPDMSLTENAALSGLERKELATTGFVSWAKAKDFAETVILRFDVRTPGAGTAARALSGGNLQKFVMGREISQQPEVFVVNQPTWGVDAAAAAAIRQELLDLAAQGCALVVVSQDLDELIEISDRFAALNEGRLSAARMTADLTMEDIGLMLGGADAHA